MDGTAGSRQRERPLSPHLQVYRPQLTSVLSILHRLTGIGLSLGAVTLVIWLVALAAGGGVWSVVAAFLDSWIGRLFLMGWVWALFFHLCTGVRHLVWDTGRGLDLPCVYRSGYAALVVSTALTGVVWAAAFF